MMSGRFLRLLLAASSLLFLPLAAGAAGGTIVVGQAIDLSGPNGSIGRDYVAGIKTCFDMLNAGGGINGRRIQYVVRDDRGQPEAAAAAVAELIEHDKADLMFGGVGADTTRAVLDSPAFKRSGQILYAPLTTADHAVSESVLFWRPSYQQEVRYLFSHFGKLGLKDVGVVYQDSASNRDAYQSLSAEIRERGMRLAGTARIGASGERAAAEAARLAATRPGFVLVIGDAVNTALFLKEFRKHGSRAFVAGTSLTNLQTLQELAGAQAMEWTVFSQVVPNPNGGTSPLQLEHLGMMKKYRDEPASSLTLEGFAAAKTLAKILQQSKTAPRSALQELAARNVSLDLGGLAVTASPGSNRLSSYLDIALFSKSSGLMF